MQRYIHIILFSCLLTFSTGCAVTPYDPFIKSRSEIYERVDTLAMMPLQGPDFDRKEEVSARYEALITERLETAGFKVIPSSEFSSIQDPMIEQMGGMFDSITGEADEEKLEAVRLHTMNELIAKFDIDAYVAPKIVLVGANWMGNAAGWDGVTDTTTGKTGFWAAFKTSNVGGTIPAMSLVVGLRDKTNSEDYYVGRGGIQLIAHYGETFAGGFVDIPESEWFVDEEKDVTAVDIALSALVNEPEPDM
jgi:hypothetical protein